MQQAQIQYQLNESAYREVDAISQSDLKRILSNPWAWQHKPCPSSTTMQFGSLFHHYLLEGGTDIQSLPYDDWRSKEAKEAKAEAEKDFAYVIKDSEYGILEAMHAAINRSPMAKKCFADNEYSANEVSFFFDVDGIWCKGRADRITKINGQTIVVDLKTTKIAQTDALSWQHIERSARAQHWDMQAAFYTKGLSELFGNVLYVMVVVEYGNEPPYCAVPVAASHEFLQQGQLKIDEALQLYRQCQNGDAPTLERYIAHELQNSDMPKL